jgi:hypothetical protein
MNRKLALRNIRTGLIVGGICVIIFGLTFVAAYVYTS